MPFHRRRRPNLLEEEGDPGWWQSAQDFAGEAADYVTDYPGRYLMQLGQYGQGRPGALMESGEAWSVWNPLGPALGDITKLGAPGLKELVNMGLWGDWQIDDAQAERLMRAIVSMAPTAGRVGPKYYSRAQQFFGNKKFKAQQMINMASPKNMSKYPGLRKDLEYSGAWEKLIALPPDTTVTLEDLKYKPIELKHMLADAPKKEARVYLPIGAVPRELRTDSEQTEFDEWIRTTPDIADAEYRKNASPEDYAGVAEFGHQGYNAALEDAPKTYRPPPEERFLSTGRGSYSARYTGEGTPEVQMPGTYYQDPQGETKYRSSMEDVLSDFGGDVVAARDALVAGSQDLVDQIDQQKASELSHIESKLDFHKRYGYLIGDDTREQVSEKQAREILAMKAQGDLAFGARGYKLNHINGNMQVIEQLGQLIEQDITNYDPVLHPTSWTRTGGTNYREIKVRYDPKSGEVYQSDDLHYGPNILSWGRMHDAHVEFDELPDDFIADTDATEMLGYEMGDTLDTLNLDEGQSKWMQKAAGIRKEEIMRQVVTNYIDRGMLRNADEGTLLNLGAWNTVLADRFQIALRNNEGSWAAIPKLEDMIVGGTASTKDIKTYYDMLEPDLRRKDLLVEANEAVPESFAYGNPPIHEVEERHHSHLFSLLHDSQQRAMSVAPAGERVRTATDWARQFAQDVERTPDKDLLQWLHESTYPNAPTPPAPTSASEAREQTRLFFDKSKLTDHQWNRLHQIFDDTTPAEKESTVRAVNAGMSLEQLNLAIRDKAISEVKTVPDPEIMKERYEWIEPTLKDMLTIAAKEGYDYISWSTPELIKKRWPSLNVDGGIADALYGRKINNWMKKHLKTKIYQTKDSGVHGKEPIYFMRVTPEKAEDINVKGFPLTQLRKKEFEAYA